MPLRALALTFLVSLATACAAPRPPAIAAVRPPAGAIVRSPEPGDPERWARAACARGEYPQELGDGAYAQARQRDLAAERAGEPAAGATMVLLQQRVIFQKRCDGWQQEAQQASADRTHDLFIRTSWSSPSR